MYFSAGLWSYHWEQSWFIKLLVWGTRLQEEWLNQQRCTVQCESHRWNLLLTLSVLNVAQSSALLFLTFPKVSDGSRVCKSGSHGQGKVLRQIYSLWGTGGRWLGVQEGGKLGWTYFLNYSSLAVPKLNPTLPLVPPLSTSPLSGSILAHSQQGEWKLLKQFWAHPRRAKRACWRMNPPEL